ncbi:DEAD/DEAH box helicase [Ruoffia tabacinasalis]|uniref:DEAD/DEAH box helicase n=1 Tax=Ruoffia tabacinasalis TaxID=87458 RepID=UPI003F972087
MTTSSERLSFLDLMNQIDEEERAQRDRGTLFELLTKAYLENEPVYRQLFDSVWLLNDVPEKYGIPKKDTGVDLVAKKRNSEELFAIQSKYYSTDHKIGKADIDSFLNEVGKSYYSEGIIFTSTPHWTNNAESALNDRDKNISRIDLIQLQESRVDWSKFSFTNPKEVELQAPKTPRIHQEDAIKAVIDGFDTANRGKLVMAPGTGKTYTSMVIAERLAEKKDGPFRVLYLVPSIQLLSQALKGWSADTKYSMDTIAVCSDRKVTKKSGSNELEDIAAADIGYPATTNYEKLLKYQEDIEGTSSKGDMLVVFSTYQSIDVTIEAQKHGFYEFDLIIADEAHRTTGATLSGEDDSHFVKVHKNSNVKAHKRLYQTATPRIYGESAHQKADEKSVLLYDMDNEELYGEELFYLGFGEAVHRGILSDYKVMVLAVDEAMVQKEMQHVFADQNNELQFDDVTKIIGTWNGLLKRKNNSNELYGEPMKRAIAFTGTIQKSKDITQMYQYIINEFVDDVDASNAYSVDIRHADGSMNALEKNQKIDWLKSHVPEKSVKILSNARFLTEGVDVPDLDAVLFLQPRRSEIDIAQAVGRVMRKSANKEYGYVILPIGVPEGVSANQVLDDNEKYSVVWDILNALRSIDERFDAMINKLELNKRKPDKINVIGIGEAPEVNEETGEYVVDDKVEQLEMNLDENWTELEHAIYGRIVQKVGTTRYWETWSKDVAKIAQQHITRINSLLESEPATAKIFEEFLKSLRYNINNSISQDGAIEMLAQHMITKPVFDALFEEESFALNNPVSKSMNIMVQRLEELGFNKATEELEGFYESVRLRAEGIDNLEAKQTIIVQLYEKFFKEAFPRTTDSLGIVFTPIEVVDFIIHSINDVLGKHFNKSLSDENVNILDPFTGTGTFVTRLIQSGLIRKEDLLRKYTQEIYANEIVLLSYYIAAINIEETFKEINSKVSNDNSYRPFEGIVLTDTFETTEQEATLNDDLFGDNNERLKRQKEAPITVVMGNPPYNIGQRSDNTIGVADSYTKLDNSIELTYGKNATGNNKKLLKDSYIRAFRWATDQLDDQGVIGFITNGSFLDSRITSGLRESWYKEFNHIYIFNLRGDATTSGEERVLEAGNVFGEGTKTPVSITILVKDQSDKHEIHYYDIGDYLSQNEKLEIIKDYQSIKSIEWGTIKPDENNDWINKRDKNYQEFIDIFGEKDSVFVTKNPGIKTHRDNWVYNFSKKELEKNIKYTIKNYNEELKKINEKLYKSDNEVTTDESKIKWSVGLRRKFNKKEKLEYNPSDLTVGMIRPFIKKHLYFNDDLVEMTRNFQDKIDSESVTIYITRNTKQKFSCLALKGIPNVHTLSTGQGFSYRSFDLGNDLFDDININSAFSNKLNLSRKDTFYYVYGILHSPEYREEFDNDLKKDYPRIPIVKNKQPFIDIGKKLMDLHLNYENIGPMEEVLIEKRGNPSYKVQSMKHGVKTDEETNKKVKDFSTIIFNRDIKIKNIPLRAYNYILSGRSAIKWIMDEYRVSAESSTGIQNDPNKYSDDPKYVLNLVLSIINVSVKTVDLVNSLPPLEIIEE